MRICLVYDCLYPHTVGGAERWYRNLAELLAANGHEVTYLTLRQWAHGLSPEVQGVNVRVVGPRLALYTASGRRRVLPPLLFGLGVLGHLFKHRRRYDVVHTASFPYFSLLAAALARGRKGYRLVVDWHEVWTRTYWREYLGPLAGVVGWLVQRICVRIPQHAFCFSALHAGRLVAEGLRGSVLKLPGEYEGPLDAVPNLTACQQVVFAGRHIPEKQVTAIPAAVREARKQYPELAALILGDGPDRPKVLTAVRNLGLEGVIQVPGFVESARVEEALSKGLCLLLPSRREGYGMVVIEAAMHGTPSILVADQDNAAIELVEEGINGFVAPTASPSDLARAIVRVQEGGSHLRTTTANWFARNVEQLTLRSSLSVVLDVYDRGDGTQEQPPPV